MVFHSKYRFAKLEAERAELDTTFKALETQWEEEKRIISELQDYRVQLDQLKSEFELAERDAELEKAAELKYSKIPELEKKVAALEKDWHKKPEENRLLKERVTEEDIARIVARWTGIPAQRLLSSESEKLSKLEDELKNRVVGQDHALTRLAQAIRRSRVGLSDENRPIGSFLFLGPTGVGKTETAKALAEALFNDEKALIRIDMSEYQEPHTIARLIGAPPGYVGYDEGGQLTEAVRRKPYSVILFDEVEKAHPQVFNTFLQILDDGRLTDGKGRTVNFKNTVLILTSNLGTQSKDIMEEVRKFFKPEFINRLDGIVVFNALDESIMTNIIDLQLKETATRLEKNNLVVEFTESLKKHLLEVGFDDMYGARPLKRMINELILDEIALQIVEGKVREKDKLTVDFKNNRVVVQKTTIN
jgi:ATP-dependent Clp protease ATP-binding subunit ClpB